MQPARFHHNVAELKHEMRAFDIQTDLRVELLLLRIERVIEYSDSNALGLWLGRLLEVVFS